MPTTMTRHSRCARRAAAAGKPLIFLAPLALAVLSACAMEGPSTTPDPAPMALSAGAETWVRTELYFGLSIPSGPHDAPLQEVSEEEWQRFVDEEISPRFPDGLTIHQVGGQWRSRPTDDHPVEIVHEKSRVVVIFHRADDAALAELGGSSASENRKIEDIRTAYKRRFHQDSVLRTDALLRVSF